MLAMEEEEEGTGGAQRVCHYDRKGEHIGEEGMGGEEERGGATYAMIPQRRQAFLHPPLRVQVSAEEEGDEEEEDGADDGPFDCVGGLFIDSECQHLAFHSMVLI